MVPTDADIIPSIEVRRNRCSELALTFQPQVICIGPSILEVNRSVVVVNDTIYSFNCGIKGVDAVFKIFQATGAVYPIEARDVWIFIQRAFYNIRTPYDTVQQNVRHLAADLNLDDRF